jgi:hypothetical protein
LDADRLPGGVEGQRLEVSPRAAVVVQAAVIGSPTDQCVAVERIGQVGLPGRRSDAATCVCAWRPRGERKARP